MACAHEWKGVERKCFITIDSPAGGGIGATFLSHFQYLMTAIYYNCIYVHKTSTLNTVSHGLNRKRCVKLLRSNDCLLLL